MNDVRNNPKDPLAWAGLVGETIDLLPFVVGVGETIKAFKAVDKVIDHSTDIAEMNRKLGIIKDAANSLSRGTNCFERCKTE